MDKIRNEDKIVFLNAQTFRGLENIKCGSAFYYVINDWKINCNILKSCARIFRSAFINRMKIIGKGQHIGFLFSNTYTSRSDYRKWFTGISDLVEDKFIICKGQNLSFMGLKYILYMPQWFKIFSKLYSAKEAFYYTSVLYTAFCDYKNIINIIMQKEIKLLVTFCDLHSVDSLITQYCNLHTIPTATLEHGIYLGGPNFYFSYSDYFLGYGEFVYRQALLSNVSEKKFIKVGMPQLISEEIPKELSQNENCIIGIIFNGSNLTEEDERMTKVVMEYAQKCGYEIYIKLHPASSKSNYKRMEWDRIKKIYSSEISVVEFGRLVEFTVISASTVFIEYCVHLLPVFLYKSQSRVFDNETWCKFTTSKELEDLVTCYRSDKDSYQRKMDDRRRYFTEIDDISNKYYDFFKEYE